jgi:hypothetical protein
MSAHPAYTLLGRPRADGFTACPAFTYSHLRYRGCDGSGNKKFVTGAVPISATEDLSLLRDAGRVAQQGRFKWTSSERARTKPVRKARGPASALA